MTAVRFFRNRIETKRRHMNMSGADFEAFLNALAAPPAPASRLVEALRRYQSL